MGVNLIAYRREGNLGNTIQTYGLSTLVGNSRGIWYDDIFNEPDEVLICNGWFQSEYQKIDTSTRVVFSGIHITDLHGYDNTKTIEWMRKSNGIVGTRDPGTNAYLSSLGIRSEFVGCSSLLLPRYDGPRNGIVCTDFGRTIDNAREITHNVPCGMSWKSKWEFTKNTLLLYQKSKCVYTNRLHVALPCIAMGTPVYVSSNVDKRRFSILDYLGVKYEQFVEIDVKKIWQTFIDFLSSQLCINAVQSEAVMPIT